MIYRTINQPSHFFVGPGDEGNRIDKGDSWGRVFSLEKGVMMVVKIMDSQRMWKMRVNQNQMAGDR